MILKGYIDESYDDQLFTLSCAMSTPSSWMSIERAWKLCLVAKNKSLRAQGRPTISRYHAADCSSRVNEFQGWSVQEQIDFVKQLLAVLTRGKNWINTIAYTLPLDEMREEYPGEDPLPHCYSAIKLLMLEMVDQIESGKKRKAYAGPFRVVLFHERCAYDSVLLDSLNKAIADPTFRGSEYFSTIAPLSWKDCEAIQVADLVAYENFKDARRRLEPRKRRKSLESLLNTRNFGGRAMSFKEGGIKRLKEEIDKLKPSSV